MKNEVQHERRHHRKANDQVNVGKNEITAHAEQDGVAQAHLIVESLEWNGRGQYKLKGVPREEKKLRENLPINTNKNIHEGQTQSQHQAPLSHEHAKHTALNQYEPIIMNMSNTQHAVKQKALIKTQP